MIDPEDKTPKGEAGLGSAAPDANQSPQPISNSAAAADSIHAPKVPIQPDDLHDLFEGSLSNEGSDEEDPLAQLRNDPNYAALIRDLEYIAQQARSLFQPSESAPSDEVWEKIQNKISQQSKEN